MTYRRVYVLRIPKVSKVNIWTWFNEQYFIQWEISLAFLKHCAVCLLSLTGLKMLKGKHIHVHILYARTHTSTWSYILTAKVAFSSPGGNDDSHYHLRARLATVPLSAVLLSYSTALLYWCSIISFLCHLKCIRELLYSEDGVGRMARANAKRHSWL